nr:MAG TPA: hypothetical protein [Bacteriophage sp.]
MRIWHKIDTITQIRAEGVYLPLRTRPTKSLIFPR